MTTVIIAMTPGQAQALTSLLDLAVRIHLCQFGEIEWMARMGILKHQTGRNLKSDEWDTAKYLADRMKNVFGFSPSASFGIGSPHVHIDAHRGYEVKKVLDKALAEWREPNPQGFRGVNYDGLTARYTDDPAPAVEAKE